MSHAFSSFKTLCFGVTGPSIRVTIIFIGLLGSLLVGNGTSVAEVVLHQDALSIHVRDIPLNTVLHDLSQEGGFRITILEQQATDNETVTEHFDALPIEEGLSRLLAHWNYGLTKQRGSGRIQTVFLASKRLKAGDLPPTTQRAIPARHTDQSESRSEYSEAKTPFSPDNASSEEHDPEEFETKETHAEEGTPLTEDMLPPDLTP